MDFISTVKAKTKHLLSQKSAVINEILSKLDHFLENIFAQESLDKLRLSAMLEILNDIASAKYGLWEIHSLCVDIFSSMLQNTQIDPIVLKSSVLPVLWLLLENDEPRVRLQASTIVSILFHNCEDASVLLEVRDKLLSKLVDNFTREGTTRVAVLGTEETISLDDTTGWKHLESYLKAVYTMVTSTVHHTTESFGNMLYGATVTFEGNTLQLCELIIKLASVHISRHVREMSFDFICNYFNVCMNIAENPEETTTTSTGVMITDVLPSAVFRPSTFNIMAGANSSPTTSSKKNLSASTAANENPSFYLNWSAASITSTTTLPDIISEALRLGMQEDWSQIRLAATKACRVFILALQHLQRGQKPQRDLGSISINADIGIKTATGRNTFTSTDTESETETVDLLSRYWPLLLPRLCMNRMYTADAIRTLSQDTWREVMGTTGRQMLTHHLGSAVEYYSSMCDSNNHMTVEAACQALSEVIIRLDRSAVLVGDRLERISSALIGCLREERWPVRDAACLPTGKLVRYYPEQSLALLPELLSLWRVNLVDCIWSVRENAALTFAEALQCTSRGNTIIFTETEAQAAKSVHASVLAICIKHIRENLLNALSDPVAVSKMSTFSFLPKAMLAGYGTKKTDNISTGGADSGKAGEADSGERMITDVMPGHGIVPNSIVPENLKKKGWGCCVDCIELRVSVPWEVTHGTVYLLRELSALHPEEATKLRSKSRRNPLVFSDEEEKDETEGGGILGAKSSFVDALFSLLLADDVKNCDKLHAAIYEEIPVILSNVCHSAKTAVVAEENNSNNGSRTRWSGVELRQMVAALSRDLASTVTGTTGVIVGSDSNRNVSKYKVNRVAAAAAAAGKPLPNTSSTTSTSTCIIGRVDNKSPRRAMAEKCIERLVSQCNVPVPMLLEMFPSQELKAIVESVLGGLAFDEPPVGGSVVVDGEVSSSSSLSGATAAGKSEMFDKYFG